MFPNWLFLTVLVFAAAWKIREVVRYEKRPSFFLKEVPGAFQIERSKLKAAVRAHIFIELGFFVSLPTFPRMLVTERAGNRNPTVNRDLPPN